MNSIEKTVVNDTVLNAGLLFAGVLWVVMAAASGPLPLTGSVGAEPVALGSPPAAATAPVHSRGHAA